ncbi:MAG: methyltransferase domain-containing protein, partial [Candidatus Latescibacteria bacterium]|nr:methyltransferase domain-containing protein [Candidatus Latescibacterota bacterium]
MTDELQAGLVLHTPALTIKNYRGMTIVVDPDAPNWIVTDDRGASILRSIDGRQTFGEIVPRYAHAWNVDLTRAYVHCHDFLKEGIRHRMVATVPFLQSSYGGRGEVLSLNRLSELWIHTNNSCNLTCTHCLVDSSPLGIRGLATHQIRSIIDQAFHLGVNRFFLTGGEPFLRKDIFDLIAAITERAELSIITNATLFKGNHIQALARVASPHLTLQVSLDGSSPEINDPIRGEGTFHRTVGGIRNLVPIGIIPTLTTVVTRSNADDIPSITRLAGELGLSHHHLMWLHARGRAIEWNGEGAILRVDRLIEVVKQARKVAPEVGVTIDNDEAMRTRIDGLPGTKNDLSNACWESLCVYADGRVYPSASFAGFEPFALGNILETPLEQIWRESSVAQEFRRASVVNKATCHACHLRFLCGGGDIEHSYFSSHQIDAKGSLLAWDPYCELYMHLIDEGMINLATERVQGRRNTGYQSPMIYYGMGERGLVCGSDTDSAASSRAHPVRTLHSNCVLTFDLDRSRTVVREFYGQAAEEPKHDLCCPTSYDPSLTAHIPQEVLSVFYGCGSPMGIADVAPGETVVDLGSGGGIDCFIGAKLVGPEGRVIGVDMTDEMLRLATTNKVKVAERLGYDVVEFRKGYLEAIPVEEAAVDLITSNCVINLSPDKRSVFREMWRILKDHGRIVIADIVSEKTVPAHLRVNEHLWGECIAGALTEDELIAFLEQAGFYGLSITKKSYWKEVEGYRFFSVTVRGYKYEKKTGCVYIGQKAIYRGPFKAIIDEEGHLFSRN